MSAIINFEGFQSQRLRAERRERRSVAPARVAVPRWAPRALPLICSFGLVLASPAQAVVIRFADPAPIVLVNDIARISVTVERAGSDTHSLFSYGVSVTGDWEALAIDPLGVVVPPELDFNGVAGPGAFIGEGDDFIGVKGTVNLSVSPIELYDGIMLAEFHFRFTQPGTYSLTLDFFNTLGPTEDIFVNQDGRAIDDEIEFRSALVQVVIPEPRMATLLLAGIGWLLVRRGRATFSSSATCRRR
jgi:hypothetical protein